MYAYPWLIKWENEEEATKEIMIPVFLQQIEKIIKKKKLKWKKRELITVLGQCSLGSTAKNAGNHEQNISPSMAYLSF